MNKNVFSGVFQKGIKIFDKAFPERIVNFRIYLFRMFCDFFFRQAILGKDVRKFKNKEKHVFFGYYDITPFSQDGNKLLAMHAPLINKALDKDNETEVGFYHLDDPSDKFISLGRTNTWCWQQGCRLQWYAGRNDQIFYNCLIDGEYGSVIKEIPDGKIIKKIKKPLYSISSDGKWGLSLDFSRLQRLRPGYGYGVLPDKTINDLKPDYNGIELVDLETNDIRELFNLKNIAKIEPHESMKGAEHYFNHIMFNPLGEKFIFFHLWMSKIGKRYSRLFVADRDGSNLKLLNNSGCVSHYNWISNNKIILYSLVEEKNKMMYAVFDSVTGEIEYFGKNIPTVDGHPTLLENEKIVITDTYPDVCSQRNLLCYDIKKDKNIVLARFDDPKYLAGEFRCDLHPRVSHNKKIICIDRIFKDKRCLSIIPLLDNNE
jgi:hypothetical protein